MNKAIHYILFNFQAIAIVASFLISLRLVDNKSIPSHLRRFFLYTTVAVLILIPAMLSAYFSVASSFGKIANNISLLFHFTFLSHFIMTVTPNKGARVFIGCMYFTFLGMMLFFLINADLTKQINQAFTISSLGLTLLCIVYYFTLFQNLPTMKLRKDPSFLIITGVFVAMSLHIPASAAIDYINGQISTLYYILLYDLLLLTYTVMHLFFIQAFLCAIRMSKA